MTEDTFPGLEELKTPADQWLEKKPSGVEKIPETWVGDREAATPFPQYARCDDPEIRTLWDKHQEALKQWTHWAMGLLKEATGNPDIKRFYNSGTIIGRRSISGVYIGDIDESMRLHWKKADREGKSTWKSTHPLAPALNKAAYEAPDFGGIPGSTFSERYIVSPRLFEHEGALWSCFSHAPNTREYHPELSPWKPIKRWEYYKALDEHEEQQA